MQISRNGIFFLCNSFYSWFDSIILAGWKKSIQQEDLYDLSHKNSCRGILPEEKIKSLTCYKTFKYKDETNLVHKLSVVL